MKKRRNTVIFDLDGTLLNTLEDLTDSVNYVMTLYHFPTHSTDQVRRMVGSGIYVLFEQAVPDGSANPSYAACVQAFQTYYASHMQIKTGPFPGIPELLAALQERGCRLAVVSNKFDAAVKALCHHYFGDTFLAAIGETPAIARKPSPDTVLEAMKQLGADRQDCIYVGDSDVDIETAENAGIPCISVSWGFRSTEFLQEHGAAWIASNTKELFDYLEKL